MSITIPLQTPLLNDKQSQNVAVPTLTFSSETTITMDNDIQFGSLLSSILNQIAVLKKMLKRSVASTTTSQAAPSTPSSTTTTAPKQFHILCSNLIFRIGKTTMNSSNENVGGDDLWVSMSQLNIQ